MLSRRKLLLAGVTAGILRPTLAQIIQFSGASIGFSDNDWPSAINRPTISGEILTWIGPLGGGPNNGNPVLQSRTLTPASGTIETTADGQIIQGMDISGDVAIRHNNTTLKQCRIASASSFLVEVVNSIETPTGVVVEDCLIDAGFNDGTTGYSPDGGGGGSIIRRCNITGSRIGVGIGENSQLIQGNWIHDLYHSVSAHTDGIDGIGGFTALDIEHNSVWATDTACITLQNEGAAFSGVTINNNLLVMQNGSCCLLFGDKGSGNLPIGSLVFTNNHLGAGLSYNDFEGTITGPITYTGNVDYLTGSPVTQNQ